MSDRKVFYSWQGDTPNKCGRSFIRFALEDACKALSNDPTVEEAPRPISVDSDTQGVAGQPPIVDTILKKIDSASVFVGDATFVAKRTDGRLVPNPNVLIEYGYALKGKTHERVILVMNTAYGSPTKDTLPFNLRHMRWPIQFALSEDASPDEKQSVKSKLTKELITALKACFETIPIQAKPGFSEAPTKNPPARFRAKDEPVGIRDRFTLGDQEQVVFLSEGPCAWLRVMPKGDQGKSFTIPDLKAAMASSSLMPLLRQSGGYSDLRNEDGIGRYCADGSTVDEKTPSNVTVPSVAFIFESGEIWSIDTSFFSFSDTHIPGSDLEHAFVDSLKSYSTFLQHIGITPPFRWIAGIHEVKNRRLAIPTRPNHTQFGEGPLCLAEIIESEGEFDGKSSAVQALLPFFSKIFQKCGLPRPDWLPQS